MTKLTKAVYQDGFVKGAAKRSADKSGSGFTQHVDGFVHRCHFGDREATINCI
jgi:hypothetical protein